VNSKQHISSEKSHHSRVFVAILEKRLTRKEQQHIAMRSSRNALEFGALIRALRCNKQRNYDNKQSQREYNQVRVRSEFIERQSFDFI
jgi:hypothetical protein